MFSHQQALQPGKLHSMVLGTPQTIQVTHGRLWITQNSDATDYFLAAGESMTLSSGQHILLQADATNELTQFQLGSTPSIPAQLEHRYRLHQFIGQLTEAVGGCRHFFHQSGILLRGLIHL